MRQIINISLPQQMAKELRANVKEDGFATVSEFFRHLIREWHNKKLIKELRASQAEARAGKGKVLNSLKDLL